MTGLETTVNGDLTKLESEDLVGAVHQRLFGAAQGGF